MHLANMIRVLLLTVAVAACASAAPILFIFSGTATGNLGGVPFTSAAFTVTSTADTSNVFVAAGSPPFQTFAVLASSATIDITGVGTLTFTDQTYWSDPNGAGDIIFGDATRNAGDYSLNRGILGFSALFVGLESYDLTHPFGPVSSPFDFETSAFNNFQNVPTNFGNLSLVSSNDVFTATVPEPGSLLLLMAAAAALRFRKR